MISNSDPNIFLSIAYPESEVGGMPSLTPVCGQLFRVAFGGKTPLVGDNPSQTIHDLQSTLMELSGLKSGAHEDARNPHFRWNVIQREQMGAAEGKVGFWALSPVLHGKGGLGLLEHIAAKLPKTGQFSDPVERCQIGLGMLYEGFQVEALRRALQVYVTERKLMVVARSMQQLEGQKVQDVLEDLQRRKWPEGLMRCIHYEVDDTCTQNFLYSALDRTVNQKGHGYFVKLPAIYILNLPEIDTPMSLRELPREAAKIVALGTTAHNGKEPPQATQMLLNIQRAFEDGRPLAELPDLDFTDYRYPKERRAPTPRVGVGPKRLKAIKQLLFEIEPIVGYLELVRKVIAEPGAESNKAASYTGIPAGKLLMGDCNAYRAEIFSEQTGLINRKLQQVFAHFADGYGFPHVSLREYKGKEIAASGYIEFKDDCTIDGLHAMVDDTEEAGFSQLRRLAKVTDRADYIPPGGGFPAQRFQEIVKHARELLTLLEVEETHGNLYLRIGRNVDAKSGESASLVEAVALSTVPGGHLNEKPLLK
jgi:hypothetical protein